jgi:hypothetical protein
MSAIIGDSTALLYSAVPATTYTELAGISDLNVPDSVVAAVKNTNYKTTNKVNDYLPGWKEGGSMEVTMDYIPTNLTTLKGMEGVRKSWKILLNDGGNFLFEGFVEKVGVKAPAEGKVTVGFSIKVCTDWAYSPT